MKLLLLMLVSTWLLVGQAGCTRRSDQHARDAASSDGTYAIKGSNLVSNGQSSSESLSDAQKHFSQGIAFYNKNRDKEAVEAFLQAIRIDPEYAEAYYRLGLAYAVIGQKEEAKEAHGKAIEAYKKLVRINPDDGAAHFHMAEAYSRLSQYEEAVKAYRQALRLQPGDSDMYYELGVAHIKLAQYQEAVAALAKASEIDAENYRASEALEKARQGLKRREAMLRRQEEALRRQEEEELEQEELEQQNSNLAVTTPRPAAGPKPSVSPRPLATPSRRVP